MSKPQVVLDYFERVLEWDNGHRSFWKPFRRWLPPRDVRIPPPFVVFWVGFNAIMVVVFSLAVLIVAEMAFGWSHWYPTVAWGRGSLLPAASYYATLSSHRQGLLIYCLNPALMVMITTLTVGAWNRRARRLQIERPAQEPEEAMTSGVWPPPPAYRK